MKGKLRLAAEAIHAAILVTDSRVTASYGRRNAGKHVTGPHIKFIPIGGPINRARRTAAKTVSGSAGMIQPGPNASLQQPNVDKRLIESAARETRMLALLVGEGAKTEEDGIDNAENLLVAFVNAVFAQFANEVTLTERWIIQDEERAGYNINGEAVAVTMDFVFPVIREERPVVKIIGASHTCKLNNTLSD
jgi:hypothetical protein